jgi:hypothetical protein
MRRVGNDAVVPEERVRVLHRRQVGCKREWTTMKKGVDERVRQQRLER